MRIAQNKTSCDNVTWTAIPAPVLCNHARVFNQDNVALKFRLDSGDPDTEFQAPEFEIGGGVISTEGRHRFEPGDTVVYAQTLSGSIDVYCRGMR